VSEAQHRIASVRRHFLKHSRPLVALATVLGCAGTAKPRPASVPASVTAPGRASGLDDELRRELVDDHAFPWAATRPLIWSDFQGSPPSDGPEGAKTAYSLSSIWKCRGTAFEFRVIAAFRARQSWVKPAVLADDVQRRTVLGHEQTHFDLAEVHARRMRQVFRDLVGPCGKTDAQLGGIVDRLAQEEKDEQRRYDAETNHGLFTPQQTAWTLETRRRLVASR